MTCHVSAKVVRIIHTLIPPLILYSILIQYQNLSRERVNPVLSSSVCDSKYSAKCARSSYTLMQL